MEEWGSHDGWVRNNHVQCFKKAGNGSKAQLQRWSKQQFGNMMAKVNQLKRKLVEIKFNHVQYEAKNEIRNTEKQIENLLMDEETYWRQRSRVEWLKEGDRNTKFFYSKALAPMKKNMIWGVLNQQNVWVEDEEEVERQFCNYFTNLFTTSSPIKECILDAL
ncbi:uncharacterized protein LOC112099919 [Citrus clementina]|uniref:uncharacterized protein LOC112099919 n=1 Tax=Citrus clementina TaxID=85681 RepID=UPI000CECF682|nr:uncharacterized protein LOC112099919 [Citrus x clementina]